MDIRTHTNMHLKKVMICVLFALLSITNLAHALEDKNRLSFYVDVSDHSSFSGLDWVFELSESKSLGMFEISGEYSCLSRFMCKWDNSFDADLDIDHYRYYLNFNHPQTGLRLGLQRLNFGSAEVLRPLMWFDNMDPMDAYQETKGVEAILLRHHWLNNANLWLWGIRGRENPKGNEFVGSKKNTLEYGGRFQYPSFVGDAGINYHQRKLSKGQEYRLGFDLRIDHVIGCWLESSASYFEGYKEPFSYSAFACIGADYVFDIGNGLAITAEGMLHGISYSDLTKISFHDFAIATIADYPLGILDSIRLFTSYAIDKEEYTIAGYWHRNYDFIALDLGLSNSKSRGNSVNLIISSVFVRERKQ